MHGKLGKPFVDQRLGCLGRIPQPPRFLPQSVAKFSLADASVLAGAKVKPSDELLSGLLDGRPEAVAVESVIVRKPRRKRVNQVVDIDRSSIVDEPFYSRIAVELDQQGQIGHRKSAKHKPICFQKNVHNLSMPTKRSTSGCLHVAARPDRTSLTAPVVND